MLDKLLCIYHSFTMEVSLLQIINTKKLTKSACSSRVLVQYVNRKFLQFCKGYFTNSYQMKELEIQLNIFVNLQENFAIFSDFKGLLINFYHLKGLENKKFCKFKLTKSDFFKILSNFLTFMTFFFKTPYFSSLLSFF